jgi:hypothetical protein
MESTYNPLLGEDLQPRSRRLGRRYGPEPGVALVVHREGRPLTILADPTDRLTSGETWWANIKAVYRVDLTDHLLEFEEQLPGAGHASYFQVRLRVGCAVKDPIAAVRRGVNDAAGALHRVLMDAMAEVSLRFPAHQATAARQAIRAALVEREETVGFSPVFRLHDMAVELTLDEATIEHLQSVADAERSADRTAMGIQQQQRLEAQRAEAERERDRLRHERDLARAAAEQERVRAEAKVKHVEAEASAELEREKDRLEAERNRLRIEHEQVLVELERAKLDRQAMSDRLKAELERERKWEDAVLETRIERVKGQLELERADQKQQLYLQAIASGDWQQLAVLLTRSDDPDVIVKLIGMVREERQADLDRQLETLKVLLEQEALEGTELTQVASAGKQLLKRFITTWSQPAFPATDAEHPSPTEDGKDAP